MVNGAGAPHLHMALDCSVAATPVKGHYVIVWRLVLGMPKSHRHDGPLWWRSLGWDLAIWSMSTVVLPPMVRSYYLYSFIMLIFNFSFEYFKLIQRSRYFFDWINISIAKRVESKTLVFSRIKQQAKLDGCFKKMLKAKPSSFQGLSNKVILKLTVYVQQSICFYIVPNESSFQYLIL
jgi:hypothetical protein